MDGPSNFRPIQPAPPSGAPASGAAAGESDGEDKRPKAPPQPGRRASGLAACDSCRKRKIKVSKEAYQSARTRSDPEATRFFLGGGGCSDGQSRPPGGLVAHRMGGGTKKK